MTAPPAAIAASATPAQAGTFGALLVAMARHQDTRSGFRGRALATRELPPVAALEELVREWCGYVPQILPVALALEAALIAGEDGAAAWRDRMGELHQAFRFAISRLETAGQLMPDWTAEEAADWAWAQVQPSIFLHLVGERGWREEDYVRRTAATVVGRLANV